MPILPRRFERIKSVLKSRMADLTVLVEHVEKPHNLSAILRSCDAVGVLEAHAVCKEGKASTFNSTAQGSQKWVHLREHKNIQSAVVESCKRRFRPIMMTSSSTLIAMVPLIVGNIGPGAGEGIRLAVGCTIFGGMLISTFLTLFTTPVFYLLLCKNSRRMDEIDIQLNKELSK